MSAYNVERIPRKAEALQWTGQNTDDVMAVLVQHKMIGEMYRDNFISIRFEGRNHHTLRHGDWLLVGEDRQLRFYTDDKYSNPPMYRPISDELERLRAFAECVLSLADTVKRYGFKDVDIYYLYRYAKKHGITAESLKVTE